MTTHFIQISDTHLGPTPTYELYGYNTYSHTEHLITCINALEAPLDFVIHTGDIVNEPDDPAGYALAAELFARLKVPIYFVNGNHDRAAMLAKHMQFGAHQTILSDELCYSFAHGNERFIVLDGQTTDALAPRGEVSAEQLTKLADFLAASSGPKSVFIHYPAFSLNAGWMDDLSWMNSDGFMHLMNGQAMHDLLAPHRDSLRGVFHGHLHRPFQLQQGGITYWGGPSAFAHFASYPTTAIPVVDVDTRPGFNYVQLLPERTIVQFMGV